MVQSLYERHRWWLAAVITLVTAAAVFGITQLRLDDDLRGLLRGSADDFARVDVVAERFGSDDRDCIVRVDARDGDMLTPAVIGQLRRLAERLRSTEGVEDVRSLLEIRRAGMLGGILTAVPRHFETEDDPEIVGAVRARVIRHPLVAGTLLSADARSTLLQVQLTESAATPPQLDAALAGVQAVLDDVAGEGLIGVELTGMPVLRQQAIASLRRDILLFNSFGLIVAVVLSALAARSWRATLLASLPATVGAIWATGLLALFDVPINMLTCIVPSLAMVVGTCDAIHFIEDMRRSARRGVEARQASSSAVSRVGAACGITSLVTAVGFLSLAVARIEAVRTFGLVAAAGAVASFLAVTALTPLMASDRLWEGAHLGQSPRGIRRLASRLASWSLARPFGLATAGVIATIVLAGFSGGIDADNRIADALPRGAAASRALAGIDEDFGGTMGVDVVIEWPEDILWDDPDVAALVQQVEDVLQAEGTMSPPISLASIAASLGERGLQRVSSDQLDGLVDPPSRSAVVRARVRDDGSRSLEAVFDRIETSLAALREQHPGWSLELVGMPVISARNVRQLIRDLASSLVVEVIVIGSIIAVAFRSPVAGIVSLVPNLFPLAAVAAVLVASGGALDPASVIVFNVCLGLSVDDTVHLLSAVKRHRRPGVELPDAVRRAMVEAGTPVVLGGGVLAAAFAGVMLSSVPSLARFGLLASSAAVAATVAELLLLPATLVATTAIATAISRRTSEGFAAWIAASQNPHTRSLSPGDR